MGIGTLLGTLGVKLTADDKEFNAKLDDASDRITSFGKTAAIGLGALSGATLFAVKALEAQEKAELKLESAVAGAGAGLGINTEALKAYAAELQKVTTFGDEATIEGMALLASFQLNEAEIKKLTPVMQNMSAMLGQDLTQSALQLGRALTVGAGALTRSGVTMSEAQKKAFKLADGVERVNLLADIMNNNFTNTAEMLATTVNGSLKQLINNLGDVAEDMGKVISVPLTPFLQDLTVEVGSFNDIIKRLSPRNKTWIITTGLVTGAVLALVSAVGLLVGAISLVPTAVLGVVATIGILTATIGGLIDATAFLGNTWGTVVNVMIRAFSPLANAISTIQQLWAIGWKEVLASFLDTLATVVDGALDLMTPLIGVLGKVAQLAGGTTVGTGFKAIASDLRASIAEGGKEAGESIQDKAIKAFKQLESKFDLAQFFEGFEVPGLGKAGGKAGKAGEATIELEQDTAGQMQALREQEIKDREEYLARIKKRSEDRINFETDLANATAKRAAEQQALLASGDIASLLGATGELAQGIRTAAGTIGDVVSTLASKAGGAVQGIIEAGTKGFEAGGIYGAIIAVIMEILGNLKSIMSAFDQINVGLEVLFEALSPLFDFLPKLFEGLNKVLVPIFEVLGVVMEGIGNLLEDIVGSFAGVFEPIGDFIKAFVPILEALFEMFRAGSKLITSFSLVRGVFELLVSAIKPFTDMLTEIFTVFGEAVNWITTAFEDAMYEVGKFLRDIGLGDFGSELMRPKATREREAVLSKLSDDEREMHELREKAFRGDAEAQAELGQKMIEMNKRAIDAAEKEEEARRKGLTRRQREIEDLERKIADAQAIGDTEVVEELQDSLKELTTDTDTLAKSVEKASNEILNAPSVFRIATERIRAGMGINDALLPAGASAGGGTMNIENVTIMDPNPRNLMQQIEAEAKWQNTVANGAPSTVPVPGNS